MNQLFNYYEADIKRSAPKGIVSLEYVLNAIRKPKNNIQYIFDQIRIAEETGDMAKKAELKTKLYSFTPCVLVQNSRKYDNIIDFTGLLVLDFDHLDKNIAVEFKQYLFNEYKFIYSVWLSASRHGVRAIVKIPKVNNVDEFKHYFAGIEKKLSGYNGFDTAPKNCILPMFISYDENILIRDNPIEWQTKYIPVVAPPVKQYIVNDKSSAIEKIIAKKIIPIIDNGHPQLRAAAYLMGGYCGAGYIDRDEAITILHNLIESNAYLSQKAAIYKRTAIEMVDKGINQPTFLPTN